MQEQPNPIKDYLFEYISKSEQEIQKLITEKKFSDLIDKIVTDCYDKVLTLGQKDESVGVLATGLLHFLLTQALLPSQRKVEYLGIDIDIVIPDLKTLQKDSKKTLVICIPKTSDKQKIDEKIAELEKIQPQKENIWIVLSENIQTDKKSFVLNKKENSFNKIIFDIAQFSNVVGSTSKFKILKI